MECLRYTRVVMHAHWGLEAVVVDYVRQDSDQLLGYWTRTAQTFILFNNYTTYCQRLVEIPTDLVNVRVTLSRLNKRLLFSFTNFSLEIIDILFNKKCEIPIEFREIYGTHRVLRIKILKISLLPYF